MQKIVILMLSLFISFTLMAQRDSDRRERIKAQKVAFITERLELTPKEAQEFWPIYNAFEENTHEMRHSDLKKIRETMRRDNLSDKEAQEVITKYMTYEDKLHAAKKQLVKDLSTAIPPQKIIKLKAAEDAFNRKLMEMLRERRKKKQESIPKGE